LGSARVGSPGVVSKALSHKGGPVRRVPKRDPQGYSRRESQNCLARGFPQWCFPKGGPRRGGRQGGSNKGIPSSGFPEGLSDKGGPTGGFVPKAAYIRRGPLGSALGGLPGCSPGGSRRVVLRG
jgi:hypothetical protein